MNDPTTEGADESVPPPCPTHLEVQHRDKMPPWCNTCGWNRGRPAILPRKIGEPR